MVDYIAAGLSSLTASVQVAAAWALANAADAAAQSPCTGLNAADIPAVIAQSEPLHRLQHATLQLGEQCCPNLS